MTSWSLLVDSYVLHGLLLTVVVFCAMGLGGSLERARRRYCPRCRAWTKGEPEE